MDPALTELYQTIKKLIHQIHSINAKLSFTLIAGKSPQGKSSLLRQSSLKHLSVDTELTTEVYYNNEGIIIEMGEKSIARNPSLLIQVIKQLNKCHPHCKITGLLYCIDITNLISSEPQALHEFTQSNILLLTHLNKAFDYPLNLGILFTHMDGLAGFCEYFQNESSENLKKPLGFSFNPTAQKDTIKKQFRHKYEQLVESLNQQVISKIHPIRSHLKRTLIREFPLQVASLRVNIQSLIQKLPFSNLRLNALYFSSSEQGGFSEDRINKRVKHEYALTLQDKHHQSREDLYLWIYYETQIHKHKHCRVD